MDNLLLDLALADHLLDGLALDGELRQRPLALRQRRLFAVLALEGAHLVMHSVDKALALLFIDVDRLEDRLVDLLPALPTEDRAHAALRRAVVQGEAALRRDALAAFLLGEFAVKVLVEEVFHLLLQVLVDLRAALTDEVGRHRLLGAVIVGQLYHLAAVHRCRNVCFIVEAGRNVQREILFLRRRAQALDGLARLALDRLRRPVVRDKLLNIAVIARAVLDLHAQLFERFRALEFVLALVAQPLSLFRRLLRTPAGKIGVQIREFLHVRLLAALVLHALHGLLHAVRHPRQLLVPLAAVLVFRRKAHVLDAVDLIKAVCVVSRAVLHDVHARIAHLAQEVARRIIRRDNGKRFIEADDALRLGLKIADRDLRGDIK